MLPPKLHAFFCLCSCLTLVHTFDWQDLSPVTHIKSSAWFNKIQALMATALFDQTKIPRGSGPYSVGCTDLMFGYTNKSIFLRLYYPSQDDKYVKTLWVPNKEYFFGLTKFLQVPWFVGKILNFLFGSMTIPANWNPHLRTGEKYPLIVFSHGFSAFRTIYSAFGINMASHGFIVAALEHRDQSAAATYYFNDQHAAETMNMSWHYLNVENQGKGSKILRNVQVRQRAKECSQALNYILCTDCEKPMKNVLDIEFDLEQLKDSIDTNKIAVIGHSFGGSTTIQSLYDDHRFRCGIALDAWMFPLHEEILPRFPQPVFFINSVQLQYPDNIRIMKKCYVPGKERKMITIKGSVHHNFDDVSFITGKMIGYILTLRGEIDPRVAIDLFSKASLAFLQKHLELQKNFDQWDYLVEGKDENLIPGANTNVTLQK